MRDQGKRRRSRWRGGRRRKRRRRRKERKDEEKGGGAGGRGAEKKFLPCRYSLLLWGLEQVALETAAHGAVFVRVHVRAHVRALSPAARNHVELRCLWIFNELSYVYLRKGITVYQARVQFADAAGATICGQRMLRCAQVNTVQLKQDPFLASGGEKKRRKKKWSSKTTAEPFRTVWVFK